MDIVRHDAHIRSLEQRGRNAEVLQDVGARVFRCETALRRAAGLDAAPLPAERLSDLFGSALEVSETQGPSGSSYGTRYRPALEVGNALALPAGYVAVFSQGLRLLAQDSRTAMSDWLAKLPPAPAAATPEPPVVGAPPAPAAAAAPSPPPAEPPARYW